MWGRRACTGIGQGSMLGAMRGSQGSQRQFAARALPRLCVPTWGKEVAGCFARLLFVLFSVAGLMAKCLEKFGLVCLCFRKQLASLLWKT